MADAHQPEIRDEPPADPEAWTDEQWLAWLGATDAPDVTADADGDRPATRVGRIAASRSGSMLGNAMSGVAAAIYGPREEVVVVSEADGDEPGDDEPFHVKLDPHHPERSVVVHRPLSPSAPPPPPPPPT